MLAELCQKLYAEIPPLPEFQQRAEYKWRLRLWKRLLFATIFLSTIGITLLVFLGTQALLPAWPTWKWVLVGILSTLAFGAAGVFIGPRIAVSLFIDTIRQDKNSLAALEFQLYAIPAAAKLTYAEFLKDSLEQVRDENPEKAIRRLLENCRERLTRYKQNVAIVIADGRKLESDRAAIDQELERCDAVAALGGEEAKRAEQRRAEVRELATRLEQVIRRNRALEDRTKQHLRRFNDAVEEIRRIANKPTLLRADKPGFSDVEKAFSVALSVIDN